MSDLLTFFCPPDDGGCAWKGDQPNVAGEGATHWYACPSCGHWVKVQPC
jgi:hypothetical protein